MANWAYVNGGQVLERYDILPDSRNNISGIRNLSPEDQRAIGFYPVIKDEPIGFDGTKYQIIGPTFTVYDDHVFEKWELVEYSEEEQTKRYNEARMMVLQDLRQKRDYLLQQTDWTQVIDATPPGGREAWTVYRQQLRDAPNLIDDTFTVGMAAYNFLPEPPAQLKVLEVATNN